MKIAICDRDKSMCAWLRDTIEGYGKQEKQFLSISTFLSTKEFYASLDDHQNFDLLFLAVTLSEKWDGVQIGEYLRYSLKNYRTQIIYMGTGLRAAARIIHTRPFDWLEKPLKEEEVKRNLKYISETFCQLELVFQFTYKKRTYFLHYSDILFLAGNLRKIEIHAVDGIYEFYGKISEVLELFTRKCFVQIQQSILVNMFCIHEVKDIEVHLKDGSCLYMSRNFKKSVYERLKGFHGWTVDETS